MKKAIPKRGFILPNKAWYSHACPGVSIDLGLINSDGELTDCFILEWDTRLNPIDSVPFLRAYSDSWDALASMSDLIGRLQTFAKEAPSQEKIIELLKELGFEDNTPYTNPDEDILGNLRKQALAKLSPQERTALNL